MLRLAAIVYILVAPTLMGILITALLTMDDRVYASVGIIGAAVAGAVLALPVAWILAKKISPALSR